MRIQPAQPIQSRARKRMEATGCTTSVFAITNAVPASLNFASCSQDRGAFWPDAAPVKKPITPVPRNRKG
jgi:hypothetical protein